MSKLLLLSTTALLLTSCYRVSDRIDPKIEYSVQEAYLKRLPPAFAPLSRAELTEGWGHEYQIGLGFSKMLDLYQAITAFKRALILIPEKNPRHIEIEYEVLFCYYLAKKYDAVLETFETSHLRQATPDFIAYNDLLVILYDAYQAQNNPQAANQILQLIEQHHPETAKTLTLSYNLAHGNIDDAKALAPTNSSFEALLTSYENERKSVSKAKTYNALLPGAGYLYLGQTQSAITAFLLNGLFITASALCFTHHNAAAGAIFASFECGWYFGGIYGAGEEAKFYNERLYECKLGPAMNHEHLFPIFTLKHAF